MCRGSQAWAGATAETYRVRRIGRLYTLSLEQESDGLEALALPLAKRGHELLELGRPLDLEENLVVVVRDLDIQMLDWRRGIATGRASTLVLLRHYG